MTAFLTTPRRSLTDQQSAKLFLERGGKCESCTRKITPGEGGWDWDHRLSLENGGSNDPGNLQLLCKNCHVAKTATDRKTAAKTRSVATRGIVPEAHRQKSRLAKQPGFKFDWGKRRYVYGAEDPTGETE